MFAQYLLLLFYIFVVGARRDPTLLHAEWHTETGENATFTNHPGGRFTMEWTRASGYTIGGVGWKPGQLNRTLTYSGTFKGNGYSSLAVYGWTRNPLVEYYIVDSWGYLIPSSLAFVRGHVDIDRGTYTVASRTMIDQPSIDGTATFQQFWSTRSIKRVGGNIDVAAHFKAWEELGMVLGRDHDYQILACEGQYTDGACDLTVTDLGP